MNIKKTLGSLIIALVMGALSYLTFLFLNVSGGQFATKILIIFGTLGLFFLILSIGLIGSLKNKT
ncbi:MAG: hypothetical protein PHW92_03045 [Lutibacter sp.]|nr:hypothetical protein [Lutibacter sp.]